LGRPQTTADREFADCLARDAVRSEPFSAKSFPDSGRFTGNLSRTGLFGGEGMFRSRQISAVCAGVSLLAITGKFFALSGKVQGRRRWDQRTRIK